MADGFESGGDLDVTLVDLFEGSSEGILVHDETGTVIDANGAAEHYYGQTVASLRGSAVEALVVEDGAVTDLSTVAARQGTVRWTVAKPDRPDRTLDVSVSRASSGEQWLSFATDITDHERRESSLESNQATFRRLQEIVSSRGLTFDEKVERLLGLGRDWLGLSVGYVTHIQAGTQTIEAAIGDHDDIQPGSRAPLSESYCQHTLAADDEAVRTIQSAAAAGIRDSEEYERFGLSCYLGGQITVGGESYGTVCFADTEPRDRPFTEMERTFVDLLTQWIGMTIEQRERVAASNRQRALLESVFNSQRTQVGVTDTDGRVVDANEAAVAFVGKAPDELVGEFVWDTPWFESESARVQCRRAVERALDGEMANFEISYDPADGPEAVFSTNVRPVLNDGEVIHAVVEGHEITELRNREERLERLSSATNELLYTHTESGVAATVTAIAQYIIDRPLAAMWAYDESDETLYPIGSTAAAADFADAAVPEELPAMGPESREKAIFDSGEATLIEDYQTVGNPSAPDVPLRTMFCLPLDDHGLLCVGSPTVEEFAESERFLLEILAGTAAAALDRVRREAELQSHREELERSNEALQQFAYVASHDLQEPLRMVASYVDLLEAEYGDELDGEAREYMDFAVDGAHRMQDMLTALLQYSRVETDAGEFAEIATDRVVQQTLDALQLRIDETDATVETGSLPPVRADPDQLGQVFQNLFENAIRYAEESGVEPHVEVTATREGETVTFTVADNGPGVPAGMADDIFEIFTRGCQATEGTGVGLAVCRRIVRRHDGRIWVAETDEAGAAFRFTLPAPTEGSE
ncbi:ATP-binding protein [Haloarcula onubensis]|uniref:histidine kinase n=1 Tax=Haloarcula onubensis TaxID=2950539 RepID=A0ABU2FLV7_9EURY|nr:ATP-binding protein [Halomicroarcula sp. S3CR25-11]MDS0281754.1 PAS domain-containing protein [Halomicroarcula sp. S3CR25-11]